MRPPFSGKPKGQLLGKGPQDPVGGRGKNPDCFSPPRAALNFTPLCLPGLCGQGQGLAVISVSTHKTWLIPLVLAKLMMGNWDTMGLISWLGVS